MLPNTTWKVACSSFLDKTVLSNKQKQPHAICSMASVIFSNVVLSLCFGLTSPIISDNWSRWLGFTGIIIQKHLKATILEKTFVCGHFSVWAYMKCPSLPTGPSNQITTCSNSPRFQADVSISPKTLELLWNTVSQALVLQRLWTSAPRISSQCS